MSIDLNQAAFASRSEGIGLPTLQIANMVARQSDGAAGESAAPLKHPDHVLWKQSFPTEPNYYISVSID